ncbi:MAG: phenylalanine--tRNA ligase subunit beta [Candidatus Komeilibacteria bacterium]
MKISLNWLKEHVNISEQISPQALGDRLTMSTVEVEEVISAGEQYNKMVIGQVKEIVPHPDADRLQVCQVDIGQSERVSIVCGGTNLTAQMYTVVALPGARVRWHGEGEPVELAATKIRGVSSHGMICAASEIGLEHRWPQENERIIIDLGEGDWRVGQPLAEALAMDEFIYDIDNKSITHRPDLWGHYGMAREVAAITGSKLKTLSLDDIKNGSGSKLRVAVEDEQLCLRYQALVIDNIEIKPSPQWLQDRLAAVGVRAINNIVDITNYVLFDLGQPLHAFDAQKISGDQIVVRRARAKEEIITLDGEKRSLRTEDLVIADADKPIAIAGVMGGINSEIDDKTSSIVIESANFQSTSVRRTALAHGLRTEASARFEKSLDPQQTDMALRLVIQLIRQCCPEAKIISKVIDINNVKSQPTIIKTSVEWLNSRIGINLSYKKIKEILTALGFAVQAKKNDLQITVPSWRATKDISIPEDIVEEVARIYGYDQIPDTLPAVKLSGVDQDSSSRLKRQLKSIMAQEFGSHEVYNYSWQAKSYLELLGLSAKNCISLRNYLTPEQQYLRPTLLTNLLKNLHDNLRWYDSIDIFEVGRVYRPVVGTWNADSKNHQALPEQPEMLGWLAYNTDGKDLFYNYKGKLEYLGRRLHLDWKLIPTKDYNFLRPGAALAIQVADQVIGYFGLLADSVRQDLSLSSVAIVVELDFTAMVKYSKRKATYQSLPKYPVVIKDWSVVMQPTVSWQQIYDAILATNPLVREVQVFDRYFDEKSGQYSVAFHVTLYDDTQTMNSESINKIMLAIDRQLEQKLKLTIKKQ